MANNKTKVCLKNRDDLYNWLKECKPNKLDEVQIKLDNLNGGTLDMSVYVNGKETSLVVLSQVLNPIPDIRQWLEQIVKNEYEVVSLDILNGERRFTLCFEHLKEKENDVIEYNKCKQQFECGIFYLQDYDNECIPTKAIVKTKDFVSTFYMCFLTYDGYCGESTKRPLNFNKDWFCMEDDKRTNWEFYADMKSSLIEWFMEAKEAYHPSMKFRNTAKVDTMIHMWAEWGDALFWVIDGCCGGTEELLVMR